MVNHMMMRLVILIKGRGADIDQVDLVGEADPVHLDQGWKQILII